MIVDYNDNTPEKFHVDARERTVRGRDFFIKGIALDRTLGEEFEYVEGAIRFRFTARRMHIIDSDAYSVTRFSTAPSGDPPEFWSFSAEQQTRARSNILKALAVYEDADSPRPPTGRAVILKRAVQR